MGRSFGVRRKSENLPAVSLYISVPAIWNTAQVRYPQFRSFCNLYKAQNFHEVLKPPFSIARTAVFLLFENAFAQKVKTNKRESKN